MDLSNWGPVGTPDQIAEWIRTFAEAGVDHFICRFGAIDQFAQVERFAKEVLPAILRREGEVSDGHCCRPSSLLKDAALVVDVCFSVEEGDVVTIICDDDREDEARAVAEVCVERGALARDHEQRDAGAPRPRRRALPDGAAGEPAPRDGRLGRGDHHHQPRVGEPLRARQRRPRDVRGEREDRLDRAGHGRVGPDARRTSRRSTQRTKDAVAALEGKTQCHVTTPLGTDFYVSIEGRPPLCLTPYKARGQMMSPIPLWTEVAFAAIEDFTHGTAVVDGVMLGIGLEGQVKEPIRWTLEGGKCVKIEGGEEAERLRKAIDGVENATVIGEFAFGTSEKAPFGTPSEKGRIGTVHLALGDNHNAYPGGQNHCSLHLDGVFLNATLQIVDDGTYILKDGEWAL